MKKIYKIKNKLLFRLMVIAILSIIIGILYISILNTSNIEKIKKSLQLFFKGINKLDYTKAIINCITSNLFYLVLVWILGISIIGVPIILFLLFFKGFIFGFNFSSIITNYGLKGVLPGIFYQLPHQLLLLIFFVMISFYAINFSVRLFRVLFLKESINLTQCFKRYNQIGIICVIGILLCSIFETFVMPILMNLFL